MDFKNVQKITVPQGDVLKIVDSRNNTIWRKRMFPSVEIFPPGGGTVIFSPDSPFYGDKIRYGTDFRVHAAPNSGYKFTKYEIPSYSYDVDGKPIMLGSCREETSIDFVYGNVITDVVISVFFENDVPPPV